MRSVLSARIPRRLCSQIATAAYKQWRAWRSLEVVRAQEHQIEEQEMEESGSEKGDAEEDSGTDTGEGGFGGAGAPALSRPLVPALLLCLAFSCAPSRSRQVRPTRPGPPAPVYHSGLRLPLLPTPPDPQEVSTPTKGNGKEKGNTMVESEEEEESDA